MKFTLRSSLVFSLLLQVTQAADPLSVSLRSEGQDAVQRGLAYVKAAQKEDGHWSSPQWPALTGLNLWALTLSEDGRTSEEANRAVTFLKGHTHPNGAIYVDPNEQVKAGGKPNYNTAICMVALHMTGRKDVAEIVRKARNYVASSQHLGGDVYHGGFGYDAATERAYADLSNTYIAMEGLALTAGAEDGPVQPTSSATVDKKGVEAFVSSIQNLKESNDADWVSETPENKGGFAYHPQESKAGTIESEDGKVYFRSFGSMTYAGLLSLIYADVDRSDLRIQSALEWSVRHWSLEQNPGMEKQGYYYFLNVLTKALVVYGQDDLKRPDGTKLNWREEVVTKLVSLQRIDENGNGYWQNDENRFWENDPNLVTPYTLIALQIALGMPESD